MTLKNKILIIVGGICLQITGFNKIIKNNIIKNYSTKSGRNLHPCPYQR